MATDPNAHIRRLAPLLGTEETVHCPEGEGVLLGLSVAEHHYKHGSARIVLFSGRELTAHAGQVFAGPDATPDPMPEA